MSREFIITEQFEKQIAVFKNSEQLLRDIEQEVLRDLEKPASKRDIISGTGGFRKVRVALKSESRGKSGSLRIIYFDLMKAEVTFLFMAYSKAKVSNISANVKSFLRVKAKEFQIWQSKKK